MAVREGKDVWNDVDLSGEFKHSVRSWSREGGLIYIYMYTCTNNINNNEQCSTKININMEWLMTGVEYIAVIDRPVSGMLSNLGQVRKH